MCYGYYVILIKIIIPILKTNNFVLKKVPERHSGMFSQKKSTDQE
jgi:hypothetical protein